MDTFFIAPVAYRKLLSGRQSIGERIKSEWWDRKPEQG